MRIATLVPSATDLVCALDLGEALVGVSHECDHPAARGRPVVTRSQIPAAPAQAPAAVDRAVSEALASGRSLYVADRARLDALAPDLVVGQAVCDVCAVSEAVAAEALPRGSRLLTLAATSIAGLEEDLRRLGAVVGRAEVARGVFSDLERDLDRLPRALPGRRRVLALEWTDPPFLGGHWIPELVERVGAEHLIVGPGTPSRRSTWEEIRAAEPDLVVCMPCGYTLSEASEEARAASGLGRLDAEIWASDATRLFSRCTTAAVSAGAKTLAAIVSGEASSPQDALRVDPIG